MPLIEPRVLKGFRDFLPFQELKRRDMIETIEKSFRSFGFVPIDTPALEYAEILLGKGGGDTEKQIYRFSDQGGRDVALRFDLTVPFARFIAEHKSDLTFPFKRYHIAKVWRGENTQRGRYREFTQCDFDIAGSDSAAADFEILLIMRNTLQTLCKGAAEKNNAGNKGEITIRINHRGLFSRYLASLGMEEKSAEILRQVDKLGKIGRDGVQELLETIAGKNVSKKILDFISLGREGDFDSALEKCKAAAGEGDDTKRLEELRRFMKDAGISDCFALDPSITRGLDYYTGIVYETFLDKLPGIGSVCSGGRYDNLSGLYSKENIPGVGSSIGLDRLQAALEELEDAGNCTGYADAAVVCLSEDDAGKAQVSAERFRMLGLNIEVFLEVKKTSQQFMLAEKKGIPWAVIPDYAAGCFTLRNIAGRENRDNVDFETAAAIIKNKNS